MHVVGVTPIAAPTAGCEVVAADAVRQLRDLRGGPAALARVVAFGSAAVPLLEGLLRGPSEPIGQPRSLAADALGLIGGREATSALLRGLDDSVHRHLDPILEHVEYVVTNTIAENLGRLQDPSTVDGLVAALEAQALPACVDALARFGGPRIALLFVQRLGADATRERCVSALRGFDPQVVRPYLVQALGDRQLYEGMERAPWSAGRASAATLLGELGGADDALARALDDDRSEVREAAALALTARGQTPDAVLRVLVDALGSEDWMRADAAMEALLTAGEAATRHVARVLPQGRSAWAHRRRLRAIQLIGRSAHPEAHLWLWPLSDTDARTRLEIVAALGRLGSRGLPIIAQMLRDEEACVRRAATRRLLASGGLAIPALDSLRPSAGLLPYLRARRLARHLRRELRRGARARDGR